MKFLLEICTNCMQSAINAELGGADRVELCDNLWEGGTTPSMATIEMTKQCLSVPVFVLIRPRGGDFVYTAKEFEIMKRDIFWAKKAGADGIVSGLLLPNGQVDTERTKDLIKQTVPLPFTFHRAFDQTPDPYQALEDIVSCGAQRILTSGQQITAEKGIDLLKNLTDKAANRIIILSGGGINRENVKKLVSTGCREFHLSAKSYVSGLADHTQKVPMNSSPDIPENLIALTDKEKVEHVRLALDKIETATDFS